MRVGREPLGQHALGRLAEENVRAAQERGELRIVLGIQVESGLFGGIAVVEPVDAALETVHAGGIADRILRTVISIVPVENIEAAVRAHLEAYGHEPVIV